MTAVALCSATLAGASGAADDGWRLELTPYAWLVNVGFQGFLAGLTVAP